MLRSGFQASPSTSLLPFGFQSLTLEIQRTIELLLSHNFLIHTELVEVQKFRLRLSALGNLSVKK